MISGFKRASNDAFLEPEIGCIWAVEGRGQVVKMMRLLKIW